jgi:thioredoxin 1
MIEQLTPDDFDRRVLQSPIPVLLSFGGDHCGPCRLLESVLEEILHVLDGVMLVYKVNVLECAVVVNRLGIMALPTISLFREGHEVSRLVGLQNRERLLEAVQRVT